MRKVDQWFKRYGASHRHPMNETIHQICIPLISWSVLGFLWSWSPIAAYGLIVASLVFYLRLSLAIAIGMLAVAAIFVYTLTLLGPNVLPAAIAVFVAGWVAQFVGHRIEGNKPSTFDDVQFLLIAPAYLLGSLYRRFGIAY